MCTAVVPLTPSSARLSASRPIFARLLRPRLHVGLVDLHDVGAGGEQVLDLLVHGGRIVERHLLFVRVEIVLRLLRHGEGTGHRHLDHAVGVGAQEFHVAHLDRMLAARSCR